MIDAPIWKEKLEQDVSFLRRRLLQRHWSSRSIVLFERELMLMFFSIRALIEAGKLTDRTSNKEYTFLSYRNKGRVVDDNSKYDLDEVFDLDSGVEKKLTLKLLTHQFVHAYVIFTEFSEEGKVAGVLLCSDWEKKNDLIQLPIDLAIRILEDVISDEVKEIHMVRSRKTGELRKAKIL
jgi:hypothetical protein